MSHKLSMRLGFLGGMLSLVALTTCCASETKKGETKLERQLLTQAPKMIEMLREQGCKTVGVLKFRVQKAGGRMDDSAGTFNKLIADQLEAALALVNPSEPEKQLQIVRDASSVAAKIPAASHLSDEGRKRLFQAKYPLAWGNKQVEVDHFVTGVVRLAADRKSFLVGIFAVGAGESSLKALVPPFTVATDGAILNELGESFQLRGDSGQIDETADPAILAQLIQQDPEKYFPTRINSAVFLSIFYDDKFIPIEFHQGIGWIPEPREGQKVSMEIERMDTGARALGVVLKVNGENTLNRERFRNIDCQKWVLGGEWLKTTIPGFQIGDKTAEEFRVASREESCGLEMYYGEDVGCISMVVFQEMPPATTEPPQAENPAVEEEKSVEIVAVEKVMFPKNPPNDAKELKALLQQPIKSRGREIPVEVKAKTYSSNGRGLIVPGKSIPNFVRDENHVWSPKPVISAVIRYYRPKSQTPSE